MYLLLLEQSAGGSVYNAGTIDSTPFDVIVATERVALTNGEQNLACQAGGPE
jgi:hypothetical protein